MRRSKGATSSTSSTPTSASGANPSTDRMIHERWRSAPTAARSIKPKLSAISSRSRSVGAGTIRSTTELGKSTSLAIHAASAGSMRLGGLEDPRPQDAAVVEEVVE